MSEKPKKSKKPKNLFTVKQSIAIHELRLNKLQELTSIHELMLGQLMKESCVIENFCRALIETHPHPDALKAAFQKQLLASKLKQQDDAFSDRLNPEAIHQMQNQIAEVEENWIAFFSQSSATPGTSQEN
ncbi:hypothetical protein [Xylella fastidiosa]|uniref:hypothetical protein n=2 Tax=Xylella fastidiosa TaxID=2371 RepID=UPI000983681F|nr:hypothetical protein [Xylella fastidiosa]ALR08692.2 hypothetical protein XFFB_05015 [Xylella fastidiosa]WGZ35321.1 hypothetical protein O4445_05485 [Xylella fastidiosa subsp. pauca]WGZ37591.1 hypothetical protein O4443_05460 [Xylella fastidiosa subsp. pauca]